MQLDKGRVLELGPRVSDGPRTERFKELAAAQFVQEFMQVPLQRLHGLLQNEEHHHRKGQLPMSGEIFRSYPMSGNKICVAKFETQRFDQFDEMARDRLYDRSHPQGNRRAAIIVQAKSFITNML